MRRSGDCLQCGECCKQLRMTGLLNHLMAEHGSLDEAQKYYSYRGIAITDVNQESGTVCFELSIVCDKLLPDNSCALHDQPEVKPLICHRYPKGPDDIESCGYRWRGGRQNLVPE